ncbi:hypothetical protein AVEN_147567-1, partial [Araneus ventricosus]
AQFFLSSVFCICLEKKKNLGDTRQWASEGLTAPASSQRAKGETPSLGLPAHRGSSLVGTTTKTTEKIHPSPRVVPTLLSTASSSALPVVGVTPVFRCDACAREFTTKTGLGVHKRRAHTVEANDNIDTVRQKSRWSEEEALILAKAEAELIQKGGVRFMNQELAGMFAERSIEAIKKKRQSQPYKLMVKNFLDALAGPVAPVAPATPCATNLTSRLRPTRARGQQSSTAPIPANITPTISDQVSPTTGTSASSQPTVSHPDQPEIRPIPIVAFRGPYRSEMQELDDLIWAILLKLPPSNGIYSAVDIILRLNKDSPREVFLGHLASVIESAVREVTPPETQERKRSRRPAIHRNQLTRRKERKRSYALTQNLYKKNRGRCYKSIISGSLGSEFKVTQAFAQDFWVILMTPSSSTLPVLPARRPSPSPHVKVAALWGPILFEEIQQNIPRLNSAAGPDRMTPAHLRKLLWEFLTKIMNLFLWCRRVPAALLEARTIFIPKCVSPTSPGELRQQFW